MLRLPIECVFLSHRLRNAYLGLDFGFGIPMALRASRW
jgi:hypothetical protein